MAILNCWEVKKCGREPGGANVPEMGECTAATSEAHTGRNGGVNAGRYCWRVAGTFCGGEVQGAMAAKIMDCVKCDFLLKVKSEQGLLFTI